VKDEEEIDDTEMFVLSDREQEILDLVAQGLRNKEIAARLCIAEKTVKNHVSNILKALQVNSRTEAAMKAVKNRLVEKA
jgi:two-component system, NarL family, response regulator DegU